MFNRAYFNSIINRRKPSRARYDGISNFIDFISPSFGHMENFQALTLARLLISFVPMLDYLHKHKLMPKHIASFGSGSCSHECFLSDVYPRSLIDCYDSSSEYIPAYSIKKIQSSNNITFNEVAVESIDWARYNELYDFVYSIQALEHIYDADSALINLSNTVKSGGYIYIDTPFYSEMDRQEQATYLLKERARQWQEHKHYHIGFSIRGISAKLKDLGFVVVDYGYSSYYTGADDAFLKFVRSLPIYERSRSDREFIVGTSAMFYSLLNRAEYANRDKKNLIDVSKHSERQAGAIRLIARRVSKFSL